MVSKPKTRLPRLVLAGAIVAVAVPTGGDTNGSGAGTDTGNGAAATPGGDSGTAGSPGTIGVKINTNAPDFSLPDDQGRNTTLRQFTNKIVVIEWFDPLCDYTRRDYKARTPQEIFERYKDKNVVWLAINSTRDSTKDHNRAWAAKNELPFPVLDDSRKVVAGLYGITTVPAYVIVDQHGTVVYTGALDDDETRNVRHRNGTIKYVDRALHELTTGQTIMYPVSRLFGWALQ